MVDVRFLIHFLRLITNLIINFIAKSISGMVPQWILQMGRPCIDEARCICAFIS